MNLFDHINHESLVRSILNVAPIAGVPSSTPYL